MSEDDDHVPPGGPGTIGPNPLIGALHLNQATGPPRRSPSSQTFSRSAATPSDGPTASPSLSRCQNRPLLAEIHPCSPLAHGDNLARSLTTLDSGVSGRKRFVFTLSVEDGNELARSFGVAAHSVVRFLGVRGSGCGAHDIARDLACPDRYELQQTDIRAEHDHNDQQAPAGEVAAEHHDEACDDDTHDSQAVEMLEDPPSGAACSRASRRRLFRCGRRAASPERPPTDRLWRT